MSQPDINYDNEIERMHEPAVVLPDPPEPDPHDDMFDGITYPRSECCNAAMSGGIQCINCGSDGKVERLSKCCGWPIIPDIERCSKCKENV